MAKHLFIDDRFVAEASGLTRRFHQARKCDRNPIIRADRPWEKDAAFIDSAMVVYDETAGRFLAWYQGGACYGPDDGSNMCYATSADGIDWHKPSLGVVEFEGSTDNNIVLAATCMMHDPAPIIDPADPDPRRRYKAVWWGGRRDASQEDGGCSATAWASRRTASAGRSIPTTRSGWATPRSRSPSAWNAPPGGW